MASARDARGLHPVRGSRERGARELGFKGPGRHVARGLTTCRRGVDTESERLWQQVKPLYDGLHCYARARLARRYGEGKVPPASRIPAQLLATCGRSNGTDLPRISSSPIRGPALKPPTTLLAAQKWDAGRNGALGRELLYVAGISAAAQDLLGALDAHAPARPRGRVSRQCLGPWRPRAMCASRRASSPPSRICSPSTTSSGTSITS